MKNKMISIGYMGHVHCYLNISLDEAWARYFMNHPEDDPKVLGQKPPWHEFEFDDEFTAYGEVDELFGSEAKQS